MNSLNHYAYGSIVEWMYRNMCGIQPLEEAPGFQRFVIRPEAHRKLLFARAILQSSMGRIESGWKWEENGLLSIKLVIPFNTRASVVLSDAEQSSVQGLENLQSRQEGTEVKLELDAGTYAFSYYPTK